MKRFADFVIKHKRLVLAAFVAGVAVSAFAMTQVCVNYRLSDYLPADAPSTVALGVMESEFQTSQSNTKVYVPNVSISEALVLKERLRCVRGVTGISWLDDYADIGAPLELADEAIADSYYRDGGALFSLAVDTSDAGASYRELIEIAGEDGAVSGEIVNLAAAQSSVSGEVTTMLLFIVPFGIIVMALVTRSFVEPLLLILSIGVGIILNTGLNAFGSGVSYITQAVTAVLQLAISMDYALFLLRRYDEYRTAGQEPQEAMKNAIIKAAPAVAASALTTVFGFLALVLMRFRIGADMGLVLARGIVISLISVMAFLPVAILFSSPLIEKTAHRSLVPPVGRLGSGIMKLRVPVLIIVALLIVPCFLAQSSNSFLYGTSTSVDEGSREGRDTARINSLFGEETPAVLLIPKTETRLTDEAALVGELEEMPHVTSVVSYTGNVGAEIPVEFVPEVSLSELVSENYSRLIIYSDTGSEGEAAFELTENIRKAAAEHFGEDFHLLGETASTYDIMDTVTSDNAVVNLIAIAAIGIVLLFTFRSLTIPLILLLTIETAIWINLSIPYFSGTTLNYTGYLVMSTVLLGATVDYGILFTQHYFDNRKLLPKRAAAAETASQTAASIITPALILTVAGAVLSLVSSNSIVSELGLVLGRGAFISAVMVLLFLPAALCLFDGIISKTTVKAQFMKGNNIK